jgi:hypothetical protein
VESVSLILTQRATGFFPSHCQREAADFLFLKYPSFYLRASFRNSYQQK